MKQLLTLMLVAALAGGAVGGFLFFRGQAVEPLPTLTVPDDAEVQRLQEQASANPESAETWTALGIAATRQAVATSDPAYYATALDALETSIGLAPDSIDAHVALGQLQLSLHQFSAAHETGLTATELGPSTAAAWGVVTDANVELGRYDEAEVSLQTMLDLRPDLPALARASYLRQLNGDLDGAIIAMRQAQTAGGGGATGRGTGVDVLLGDLLLQRGDLAGAREAYAAAPSPAAAVGLARIAAAEGDLDRARQILDQVIDVSPQPIVVLALAEIQTRQGDEAGLATTVELGRTLSRLQQDAGQVVDLELALFEASYGDRDLAVELAAEAYDARPDNVFAAGALAWSHHRAGDDPAAADLAEDALRLGTIDTAHELRMAEITADEDAPVLSRNPFARELFLP